MGYYPMMLDMASHRVLLVGGGAAAEQKIPGLLAARAQIHVISPVITDAILTWVGEGAMDWSARAFEGRDLDGIGLVVVATSQRVLNREIARLAQERGILVNCVDDPSVCSVLAVSQIRRGSLVVSVSTCGDAPGVAKFIREQLEKEMNPEWPHLIMEAKRVRGELQQLTAPSRREAFYRWFRAQRLRFEEEGGCEEQG